MKSINDFQLAKESSTKISVITCYDYWSAKIIDNTNIDAVLVGDSGLMVMHGFEDTIAANIDVMSYHVSAVKKGIKNKFIIGDMPFLAHRKGIEYLMNSVDKIMKAGANAVKIEGGESSAEAIEYVVKSGIPVMGHLGFTPQSVNSFGGPKVQGKTNGEKLLEDAKILEKAGVFAIVLELVPAELAKKITEEISIPTIGIGAGKYTSGQVLVLHDMLGLNNGFNPKFLRKYLNGSEIISEALNNYNSDVKSNEFPAEKESF